MQKKTKSHFPLSVFEDSADISSLEVKVCNFPAQLSANIKWMKYRGLTGANIVYNLSKID